VTEVTATSPEALASLPATDPLFVAEFDPSLPDFDPTSGWNTGSRRVA